MPSRHRLVLALACALALVLSPALPASASFQSEVVALVNASRADEGRGALTQNADMDAVAQAWAEHLVAAGEFEHNPSYSSQIPGGWSGAAENLAGNSNPSPAVMHGQLMDSPGHYANIMGDFTHIGVGIAYGDDGEMSVLVEVFAHYAGSLPGDTGSGGGQSGGSGSSGGSGGGSASPDATSSPTQEPLPAGWLGPGSSGAEVEALQTDLATLGYDVDADGDFGRQTHTQVAAFQTDAGLRPDGLVGPETETAIAAALADQHTEDAATEDPTTAPSSSTPPTTETASADAAAAADSTPTDPSIATPDIVPTDAESDLTAPGGVPTPALAVVLGGGLAVLLGLLLVRRRLLARRANPLP